MQLSVLQRIALYLFFFSINFEVYDPTGIGFFSVAKIAGLIYVATLVPNLSEFFKVKKLKRFLLPIWLFFFVLTIMNVININVVDSSFFYFTLFQNIILFWIILNHERRDPGVIEKGFLSFALGSLILAILYSVGIGVGSYGGRVTIFGDNQNAVGLRMSISAIIILAIVVQGKYKFYRARFILLASLLVILPFMVNTGSRVAFISLALSFLVGTVLLKSDRIFYKFLFIAVATVIGIYGWEYLTTQGEVLYRRLQMTVEEGSLAGRLYVWSTITPLIQDNPLFGVGKTGYSQYIVEYFGDIKSPHNVLLEVMAYTGILGLVIYLSYYVRLILKAYEYYRKTGYLQCLLLFIPITGLMLSGQLLGAKIAYVIFAFAASRVFYLEPEDQLK